MPDTPLLMIWSCLIGLILFIISGVAYPHLGLPPAWLLGPVFGSMLFALCRDTFGGGR
jgi:hypothetical protein